MSNLTGRPTIGLKQPKAHKKKRSKIPPISEKKKRALKTPEHALSMQHMAWVKTLPCLVCGAAAEVHHMTDLARDNFRVIPICSFHHRREYGPQALHYSPQAFYAAHGQPLRLLAKTAHSPFLPQRYKDELAN